MAKTHSTRQYSILAGHTLASVSGCVLACLIHFPSLVSSGQLSHQSPAAGQAKRDTDQLKESGKSDEVSHKDVFGAVDVRAVLASSTEVDQQ